MKNIPQFDINFDEEDRLMISVFMMSRNLKLQQTFQKHLDNELRLCFKFQKLGAMKC